MLAQIKEQCFMNLEREKNRNNLLMFVIVLTYLLAECNVLINNPLYSKEHLIFASCWMLIFGIGFFCNNVPAFRSAFKYLMMTLLLLFAIVQILLFSEIPLVYQVLYFNLALTLIYLNSKLTLYVGASSVLFTAIAGYFFHPYFPYLNPVTLNIPVGVMIETTLVLWAVTRIGVSFSIILSKKNKLKMLLKENETQLRVIENQNKTLQSFTAQVESLVREDERIRSEEMAKKKMEKFFASLFYEMQNNLSSPDVSSVKGKIQDTIMSYRNRLDNMLSPETEMGSLEYEIHERAISFIDSTGIKIHIQIDGDSGGLPRTLRAVVLRALQDFTIRSIMYMNATEIKVNCGIKEDQIMFSISDNGIDSTGDFEEAFQLLTQKVKEHNGYIEIISVRGRGNLLTVQLPYKDVRARKIKTLIVDGDELARESVNMVLRNEEDIVILGLIDNGSKAITYCESEQPDVVVMDLQLSGASNGVETARVIKQRWPSMKVIILTNDHEVQPAVEAIEAGVDAFLLKSISPKNLAVSIRFLMDGGVLLSKQTSSLLANKILSNEKLESLEKQFIAQNVIKEYGLRDKEVQILEQLALGKKYKEIAAALFISEGTVRNYLSGLYLKLNVEDRQQAVEKALRLGIIFRTKYQTSV